MQIRKTTTADLPAVMQIYASAREFMASTGNPTQWQGAHPRQQIIEEDIAAGVSYVCEAEGAVVAVFFYCTKEDPTYATIDGSWPHDGKYGVVHRIARDTSNPAARGAGAFCLNWCAAQGLPLRIDTHQDNAPMLALLCKLGFIHCGTIWLENGDPRMAFCKL